MLLVVVIEEKHLKTGAFSAPCCMKKGKGRLCQKRNVNDSVNKLQYFPKNSLGGWKPHQFCVTLFFESNASLCGDSYKCQPTSVRSNMPTYALKPPGVSCGSPLLSPGHRVLLGGHMASFLLAKKNMPQYHESHKWKIGVKFVRMYLHISVLKVIGIGSVQVSLLGNRQPLNFCLVL